MWNLLLPLFYFAINFDSGIINSRRCCVANCKNRGRKRHRFPSWRKYPDIFKVWVERIKPLNYEILTVNEIYEKYFVCEDHFSPNDLVSSGRRGLRVTAVPCLKIPGFSSSNQENLDSVPDLSYPPDEKKTGFVLEDSSDSGPPTKRFKLSECAATSCSAENQIYCGPNLSHPSNRETLCIAPKSTAFEEGAVLEDLSDARSCNSVEVEEHLTNSDEPIFRSPYNKEERPSIAPKFTAVKKGVRRKRVSLLGQVNATRAADLTPKETILYNIIKKFSRSMAQKHKNIIAYQDRLAHAERLCQNRNFTDLLKHVNNATYNFILCQVRNQKRTAKVRRYTLEEKILALSLYKGSGKGYRLLHKIFSLPSTKTLNALLQKIPMKPGINKHIFTSLKEQVEKMKDEKERTCVLLFDEMEIDSALKYERKCDQILGFQDNGQAREPLIFDHANVFMVKGIHRQWKQPVVFSFSSGPIKSVTLKNMIKDVIKECLHIGLDVVATVCDQGATNQAAVNMLLKDTEEEFKRQNKENKYFGFVIENREIIPLYDIPHLFKGIRNNLLTKHLHFVLNGIKRVAKWSHIEQFYKLDVSEPTFRMCHKLTDAHIVPSKIKKMKVKNCTQVFSHTVGSLMKRIANWDIKDNYSLPREAEDTGELLLFLDSLFDSFNVSKYTKPGAAKSLKCPVTKTSNHLKFWLEAKKVAESMRFFSPDKNCFVSNPSLKNLIFTIRVFSYLTNNLLNKKKFKYVLTGRINQDPLENFFSYIRSHGVRNTNPDPSQFIGSFKSLVANNYMAAHSPGSNCLKDGHTEGLDNLMSFLTGKTNADITSFPNYEKKIDIPKDVVLCKRTKIGRCTGMYMGGAIIKMMTKTMSVRNCELCKSHLLKRHSAERYIDDEFIDVRQYERGNLIRPGDFSFFLIQSSLNYLFYMIPRMCTTPNIGKVLQNFLQKEFQFNHLNCPSHNLGQKLCGLIVRCSLFWWTKSVNKILKGQDAKFVTFLSANKNKSVVDPIKFSAYKKWEKRKKYVKRLQK